MLLPTERRSMEPQHGTVGAPQKCRIPGWPTPAEQPKPTSLQLQNPPEKHLLFRQTKAAA